MTESVIALDVRLEAIKREAYTHRGRIDFWYALGIVVGLGLVELLGWSLIAINTSIWTLPAGVLMAGLAQAIRNTEISHHVRPHRAWDFLGDSLMHSKRWTFFGWLFSPSAWSFSHSKHHAMTNVLEVDIDCDFGGTVRFSEDQPWEPRHRWGPFFVVVIMLTWSFSAGISMISHAPTPLHRSRYQHEFVRSLVLLAGIALIIILIGTRGWALTVVGIIAVWMLQNFWNSSLILLSHLTTATPRTTDKQFSRRAEWKLHQVTTTANVKPIVRIPLLTGGMDVQIEHHLFPNLPPRILRKVAEQVRSACTECGAPYNQVGYASGLCNILQQVFKYRKMNSALVPDGRW